MSKAVSLTQEQDLRDRWMEIVVGQGKGSVQQAMLMVAPIVDFILNGGILGVDQRDVADEPRDERRPQRSATR